MDELAVLTGVQELRHPLGVRHGVKGLHTGGAGALALAVFPLGVLLLNVGGVQQHDLKQLGGEPGGEDAALEALLDQHGDAAGVVDVGVGHQYVVDGVGGKGELIVGHLVPSLLQSAVDEDAFTVDLQAVTAAGHALVRAKETELHKGNLLAEFCVLSLCSDLIRYKCNLYIRSGRGYSPRTGN